MVNDANYDMKGYLDMAEHIARKKLEMYSKLLEDIGDFKRRFAGELWPIRLTRFYVQLVYNYYSQLACVHARDREFYTLMIMEFIRA